jgi:hypothetical protein
VGDEKRTSTIVRRLKKIKHFIKKEELFSVTDSNNGKDVDNTVDIFTAV